MIQKFHLNYICAPIYKEYTCTWIIILCILLGKPWLIYVISIMHTHLQSFQMHGLILGKHRRNT